MKPPRLRLDHIGIAVKDLTAAMERYSELLGVEPSPPEEVPAEGVRVAFFDLGGCRIELLEATGEESPIQRFLDGGRKGVHHLSLALEDGDAGELHTDLSSRGIRVLGKGPGSGSRGTRVFFVHPDSADGVLIEFSQEEGSRPSERE